MANLGIYKYVHRILLGYTLIVTLHFASNAQNDTAFSHMNLIYHTESIKQFDTSFIIFSNRPFLLYPTLVIADQIDTSALTIWYIGVSQNQCHMYQISSLEKIISAMHNRPWVIYTEGMGKRFKDNLHRAMLMSTQYNVNVIVFDFASISPELSMVKNVRFSLNNAKKSATQYGQMIAQLSVIPQIKANCVLFFHSMGNLVWQEWLKNNNGTRYLDALKPKASILNAACVNRNRCEKQTRILAEHCTVYIHHNKADRKLLGASLFTGNKKMGNRPKFYRNLPSIHYVDFNYATGKTHNYFLDIPYRKFRRSPALHKYFSSVLYGQVPDSTTLMYRCKNNQWIINR